MLAGMFLLALMALLLGHRRTLLVVSWTALAAAVLAAVVMSLFALDAVQTRVQVRPEALRAFDVSAILAFLKDGIAAALLALLGFGGVRSARSAVTATSARERSRAQLVWNHAPPDETTPG